MILAEQLVVNTEGFVLGPVDLRVEKKQHFLLLGPSGSGKSLLVEAVAGFRKLESGTLRLRQHDVAALPAETRRCGWVPQSQSLFPHLRVRQNIEYGMRAHHLGAAERDGLVKKLAQRLAIEHLLERWPGTLSGGERQRVALARTLLPSNDILLLDEPFSSLERGARKKMWELVKELHASFELTILHVTHDIEEAQSFDATMAVMMHGKIVQQGKVNEVMRNPANEAIAEALGLDLPVPTNTMRVV